MHFAPKVAMKVAECFDKIRINPGNFADGRKSFKEINYENEAEYQV
jgi:(E)-4-hydroxy-3-methylbut-2-enyl-diphosphate synthase